MKLYSDLLQSLVTTAEAAKFLSHGGPCDQSKPIKGRLTRSAVQRCWWQELQHRQVSCRRVTLLQQLHYHANGLCSASPFVRVSCFIRRCMRVVHKEDYTTLSLLLRYITKCTCLYAELPIKSTLKCLVNIVLELQSIFSHHFVQRHVCFYRCTCKYNTSEHVINWTETYSTIFWYRTLWRN